MEFKDEKQRDDYMAYRLEVSRQWFAALDLGPVTQEVMDTPMPEGAWAVPGDAAASGGKLILWGNSGTRKTTMLKRVTWNLISRRWRPRGGNVTDLLGRLKSGTIEDTMRWLYSGNLLILDDMDKLRGSGYEGERMYAILNHFDVYRFPVIVTMNTTMKEFQARLLDGGIPMDFAESICSRLNNRATFVETLGADMRRPA